MKFNEMTYTRPDIGALLARCKELAAKAAAAPDGDALVRLYYEQSEAFAEYNTAANLANIHYTCDTRDAYWKAEQDFFDANGPAVTNASVEISRAFLANPHVDALTEKFGTTCVAGMKNAVLGMDDRTVELQQQFNALVSRYQQIYGGALVELDGKQLTIPQLGPYKEDLDPAVRRAAYEAEAGYFDAHRAELDELYGEIVKNLNAQARVMGYHDYSELSYVRMNRIGYGPEEIRKFRDQVANDVVPQLQKVMALRAKRTGIARPTFTDLPIMFKLTIPTKDDLYASVIDHPSVLRVVALSGGYSRVEANEHLARNHGLIASFSRALTEGLTESMTPEEFDDALAASIVSIYEASIT